MPKHGIGVITTLDRQLHPNLLHKIDQSTVFSIQVDSERSGISRTRNRALKELYDAGCDYITLFDDDCYPIARGWQTFLEDTQDKTGVHVLTFPKDGYSYHREGALEYVHWGIGAFTFMTRTAVETVGYFNTAYDTYGHEDVAWLARARASGITGSHSHDTSPVGIRDYIYSIDCDKNEQPRSSSLTQDEKNAYIEKNRAVFDKEIADGVIFYPYVG